MKIFMVHGCPSENERQLNEKTRTYDKHWMPWSKNQLEQAGFKVCKPAMPEPWSPVYEKFKNKFEEIQVGSKDILVGHSCGCAFLVRWLGETKKKINKLILVAPWKIADGKDKIKKDFYNYEIDSTIKDRVNEIIIFTANNEEPDGKISVKIFNDYLGGKIIELRDRGHYTFSDMGTEEFPELLEIIKN